MFRIEASLRMANLTTGELWSPVAIVLLLLLSLLVLLYCNCCNNADEPSGGAPAYLSANDEKVVRCLKRTKKRRCSLISVAVTSERSIRSQCIRNNYHTSIIIKNNKWALRNNNQLQLRFPIKLRPLDTASISWWLYRLDYLKRFRVDMFESELTSQPASQRELRALTT